MEQARKKKNCHFFSILTPSRLFMIYAETEQTSREWVDVIQKAIAIIKNGGVDPSEVTAPAVDIKPAAPTSTSTTTTSTSTTTTTSSTTAATAAASIPPAASNPVAAAPAPVATRAPEPISPPLERVEDDGARYLMSYAKTQIPFLQEEDNKVLEFWEIWTESLPVSEDLGQGMSIDFFVSVSASMQKLTWRAAGPQVIFIQRMVDFFWNVGAPESEIDRLNEVGALINPSNIGSWIDMSGRGGMDGGWYFPGDIPLRMAVEAADPSPSVDRLIEWSEKHSIDTCFTVGRDMGAAPPRQTEIRLKLSGDTYEKQIVAGKDAFLMFGFPELPEGAQNILNETRPVDMCMSIITSSEGFVRLGLLCPQPDRIACMKLCSLAGSNLDDISNFESSIKVNGPQFVEYQFLKEGFGYGVYKEGFDIVFHYFVGEEARE
eukprot:TRINITY_DN4192_c0_g1_i1.p1 TRINITY_DN4192_c0_g1~~TRINITY_DN4192_c0_g1_i1.p1  ORF type:complete len:503 (+),score=182.04 TRINITY_DN4192_c0_g1_i1:213-1511(+)